MSKPHKGWFSLLYIFLAFVAVVGISTFALETTFVATRNPQVVVKYASGSQIENGQDYATMRKLFSNNPAQNVPGEQISPNLKGLSCDIYTDQQTVVTLFCHV